MSNYKLSIICILLAGFGTVNPILAQDSLLIDTDSLVYNRVPPMSTMENYANDSDFQYEGTPVNPESFRDRLLVFIFRMLNLLFGNPVGYFIIRVILYATIGALVIVLINQLIGGNLINIFNKKNSRESFSLNINEEELENMDLQSLLDDALTQSNFSSATRYLYLITLKMLHERNLITWGIEKTNIDYENELKGHPISSIFNSLTSYYEFVEYGDFSIDKVGYKDVDSLFNELKGRL